MLLVQNTFQVHMHCLKLVENATHSMEKSRPIDMTAFQSGIFCRYTVISIGLFQRLHPNVTNNNSLHPNLILILIVILVLIGQFISSKRFSEASLP